MDTLADNVDENRDEYTAALKALQENQYQIAVKLAECCASKGNSKDPVPPPTTLLPYNLAFKDNPGIIIKKGSEKKIAKEAGDWFKTPKPL